MIAAVTFVLFQIAGPQPPLPRPTPLELRQPGETFRDHSGTAAASTYRVILRDGNTIAAKAPPKRSGSVFLIQTLSGMLTSLPVEEVDEEATSRENAPKPAHRYEAEPERQRAPRPTIAIEGTRSRRAVPVPTPFVEPSPVQEAVASSFREAPPTSAPTAEPAPSPAVEDKPEVEKKSGADPRWAGILVLVILLGIVAVQLYRSSQGEKIPVSTPPPPIPATMPSFQPGPAYPQTSTPSKRTPTIVGQVSIFFGVVLFIIGALMGLNLIVCLIGVAFIVGGYMTRPDEQAKLCPACQMKVPLGAIICGYCRTSLVASSAAPLMPPPSPRKAAEAPGPPVLPSRAPEIEADAASAAALFVGAARQIRGEAGLRGRWPSGRRIDEEDPVLLELPDGRRFAFFEKCPYVLDVVGESRYQAELRALVGAFGGALPARFRAALRREPQNPYDANAVQVIALEPDVMEAPVGYLPRGIAELWAPYLDRARATTGREVLGKAETRGGTPGKPNIGVALFLEGDDVFPWVDEIAPPGVRS